MYKSPGEAFVSEWKKAYRKPVEVQVRKATEGETFRSYADTLLQAGPNDWALRLPNGVSVLITGEEFEEFYFEEDQITELRDALRWVRSALEMGTATDEVIEHINGALA